ncbi:pyridoxamine 5'-phosphate oxidase family protein [Alteromonas sp. ASW11-19]|uniref:Pyridoxamine 5'-phosphate oxidase family protein n=1 Tax=Alteromonas salexigens TaxID=2982530 RepID=A0ABT2VKZ0_9ALTE|nr:pyridoxamine 5'-phosphate oxidase family protein [Alteromonas salexigens]MCU7553970.1 pyridoxamine 5'-phosphate oxidase family protein [Alteromonas salexigens]
MPLWRQQLTKSLHQTRSTPESRYFQLATCDSEGRPQCRTVVFRGISDQHELQVISDTRSGKWDDLQGNGFAQVCWYFAKTREQYRLDVTATCLKVADNPSLLAQYWQKLSDAGKKQFLWGTPNTPRDTNQPLLAESDFDDVPEHFCLLALKVTAVDYLSLRGNPQYRERHYTDSAGDWVAKPVIP